MAFAQRRNRLTTHFSERIPVVKRRMTISKTGREPKHAQRNAKFCVHWCANFFNFAILIACLFQLTIFLILWTFFNVQWWKEIVKLLAWQFLRVVSFIVCLKFKYLPRLCYLASCTLVCFHRERDQVLYPCESWPNLMEFRRLASCPFDVILFVLL